MSCSPLHFNVVQQIRNPQNFQTLKINFCINNFFYKPTCLLKMLQFKPYNELVRDLYVYKQIKYAILNTYFYGIRVLQKSLKYNVI